MKDLRRGVHAPFGTRRISTVYMRSRVPEEPRFRRNLWVTSLGGHKAGGTSRRISVARHG